MRVTSIKFIRAFHDYSKSNAGKRKVGKEAVAEYAERIRKSGVLDI
jgi:hypothetical protein